MKKNIAEAVNKMVGQPLTEMNDVLDYVIKGLKAATGFDLRVTKESRTMPGSVGTNDISGTNYQRYTITAVAKGVDIGYTTLSFGVDDEILFGTRSGVFTSRGLEDVMQQLSTDTNKYLGTTPSGSVPRGVKGGYMNRDGYRADLTRRKGMKRQRSGN